MKLITISLVVLISFGLSIAVEIQPPETFSPGWEKTETLKFTGHDLYGYIDGGAELFYEFGFIDLTVQRYSKGDDELTLEIYRMSSPEAALGIYLSKCGQETPIIEIKARSTGNSSQYTIVKNQYFILINNFNFKDELIPDMNSLANKTLEKIPDSPPVDLLNMLPSKNLIPGSERIIRGQYSLQPIYTFGNGDIFLLKDEVFGVVGDYGDNNGNISYSLILINYPDKQDAISAFNNLIKNLDQYIEVTESDSGRLVFKDYNNKYGYVQLSKSTLNIRFNMAHHPPNK
jgi:hypothetical protein